MNDLGEVLDVNATLAVFSGMQQSRDRRSI
jgi:hypothetical protein